MKKIYAPLLATIILGSCTKEKKQPNFLFILVDDLGYYDMGYNGSEFYETPNIDRLAETGMRFNQGYAACQVCSPSRASIMTGKAPVRHGITQWIGDKASRFADHPVVPSDYVWNLPKEEITIAERLQDAGYTTFYCGKWHIGEEGSWPEDHGFMTNIGGWSSGSPKGGFFAPWINPRLESGPDGESLTMRLAKETSNFIASHDKTKPFFACLAFYAVHGPIQTSKDLRDKYLHKADSMGLIDNNQRFMFDRRLPVRQVQDNPIYAGLMESMDKAVGQVLQTLKEQGLDDNTVVIFTSDNGGVSSGDSFSSGQLPFRGGKGRQWEGGIREPYIIHVPGMTAKGAQSEVPVTGMDFYPTMLELAGLPLMPDQHADGVSLVPVLKGETIADRDLYWHYPHYGNQGGEPSSIIRSGNWKLIYYHEDFRYELYNLAADIGEQNNVLDKNPEIADALKVKLQTYLNDNNAIFPQKNPEFDAQTWEQKLERLKTDKMQALEKEHANFLKPDWEPNGDWGGSTVD